MFGNFSLFDEFYLTSCACGTTGGNEYGQCGEEPERKEDGTKALRRDIAIPQRCALKLSVRQVRKQIPHK